MKRCPECMRDYTDETLNFCLDDGTPLLEGPASGSESATVTFPRNSDEATAILPSHAFPAREASGKRSWFPLAVIAAVLAVGAGAFAIYSALNKPVAQPAKNALIEQLTTSGRAVSAAISPDGKFYIYTIDEGGMHSLWVRQRAASRDVQIIPPEEDVYYWGLTFTPDSEYINFVKVQFEKNTDWSLFQMPVLGGTQRMMIEDADGGVGYSPDGKQIAYVRVEYPTDQESSLVIANADGSGERILASRKHPESFPGRGRVPAWAPDGKTIAAIIMDESHPTGSMEVVEINVVDGQARPITTHDWNSVTQIAWLPNKSGLLVLGAAKEAKSFNAQIWSFSYPDGESRRLTTDLSDYLSLSLTADLDTLVTVSAATISNIWVLPFADSSRAVQVRSGGSNEEGMYGIGWSPQGRIFFNSGSGGKSDIATMNEDGSDPKQLTEDAGLCVPSEATPDGRFLLAVCLKDEKFNVWRMDIDGGNMRRLTNDDAAGDHVSVTPDSQTVIYTGDSAGDTSLWKVSIDGGEATQIVDRLSGDPVVSPDGKWLACAYRRDSKSTWRYAILPIEGGEPVKVFDLIGRMGSFEWSLDGKSLYYLRDTAPGVTNIWALQLDGDLTRQLTDFKTERIFNFALSKDGKKFTVARGTITSDVVLLRDFR